MLWEKNKLIDKAIYDYFNEEKNYIFSQISVLKDNFNNENISNMNEFVEIAIPKSISSEIAFNHLFVKGKEKLSKSVLIPSNNELSNNKNSNMKSFIVSGAKNLQHHSTLSLNNNNYSSQNIINHSKVNNINNTEEVDRKKDKNSNDQKNRNLNQYSKIINNLESQLGNENKSCNDSKVLTMNNKVQSEKSNNEIVNSNKNAVIEDKSLTLKSKNPSGKYMAPLAEINLSNNLSTNNSSVKEIKSENKNTDSHQILKKNNYNIVINSNRNLNPPNHLLDSLEIKEDPNKIKNINKFLTKNTNTISSINNIVGPTITNQPNTTNVFVTNTNNNQASNQTNNRYISLSNKPVIKTKVATTSKNK